MIFGRYDVFAQPKGTAAAAADSEPIELAGTDGLTVGAPPLRMATPAGAALPASGVRRAVLRFLQFYWVNSGLAVGLMLLLGLSNGYAVVWKIFGSANQLLAALALWVGTTWLMSKGRQYWFAMIPAVFMFITSITMLVWLLVKRYIPGWQAGQTGMSALLVADVIVLSMTAGVLVLTLRNWLAKGTLAAVCRSSQETQG